VSGVGGVGGVGLPCGRTDKSQGAAQTQDNLLGLGLLLFPPDWLGLLELHEEERRLDDF